MKTTDIQKVEPFNTIFPIDNKVLSAVCMDMQRNGYDAAQPVIVWKGKSILIDGHTRLEAARLVGIEDVPVVERDFSDEDEAVRYAIHLQRDRRNLTDADIVRLVSELDKRRQKGERTDLASSEAKSTGKSAEDTAKVIGTSRSKVEKVRTIKAKATPEVKAAVESGDMTVNAAYQTTRKKKSTPTTSKSTPPASKGWIAPGARGDDDVDEDTPEPVEQDNEVSDAKQYANMAIRQLQRMRDDDPHKARELRRVATWIESQLHDGNADKTPTVPTWCKYVLHGYYFARDKRDVARMQEIIGMHVVRMEDRRKGKK